MYAVIRADLAMPPGKLSAQAGHAYTDALLSCLADDPASFAAFRASGLGSKVTLAARGLDEILRLRDACLDLGLPHALVVDSGHVLPPHFDGSPIVTALGIGPCRRERLRAMTKRLPCV